MNERAIFTGACDIADPVERAAFLDRACADNPDLRKHIEELLRDQDEMGSFLAHPVDVPHQTLPFEPIAEGPGSVIGRFKLLQLIGEGGFGTVYMADQKEPVKRRVALKIVKLGMDTKEVIARFEAERQALALMDHPNIARVFDAGATDSGRPYFVMELVKGVAITDFCDQNQLAARDRLVLFAQVCQAVQHAHQKGIIHRDIKPSNVLVTLHDGKPVPKVIDFGVAKALNQELTEKTVFTAYGHMIGTPQYMSPEQAEMSGLDIDTRSDVYSLGVLLYELLTGTTPLEAAALRKAGFAEMQRLIREQEPPRPSLRVSTLGERLSVVARDRRCEPERLGSQLRGDLDWIVMMALDKDRTRRYETASSLAKDVERFLKDEAVEACPPSAWYRLRKMARRNKAAMMTAALVAATLLLGFVVSAWQAVRATQAEDAALNAEAQALAARDQEAEQRLAAEDQRKLAVAAAADAKKSEQIAQNLAKIAQEERQLALLEKQKAQANETKADRRLYAYNIASAQRECDAHNLPLANHYLDQCRPDFRGWEHDYLYTLANNSHQTLRGHTSKLYGVAFSPDGKLLASTSQGLNLKTPAGKWEAGEVKLWDASSGQEHLTLKGHNGDVRSVAFSPNGKRLATASADTSVKLWEIASGQELLTLRGHTKMVTSVAFSPTGRFLASASFDETVKVWEVASGREVLKLTGHTGGVDCVVFSPDGKRLASSAVDMTVRVWDAASGQELLKLTGHTGNVRSVAFSPDGKLLASAGANVGGAAADKSVKIWDATNGNELLTLKGHASDVQSVAFSPDGKRLASGSRDKTVILWDPVSGDKLRTLWGHTDIVFLVAFSPDGKRLASASWDQTVNVWDVASAQDILTLKGGGGCVAFSPDGKHLASASGLARGKPIEVKLWDAASGQEVLALKTGGMGRVTSPFFVDCVAFSLDGKRLAANSGFISIRDVRPLSSTVQIWDAASGHEVLTLKEKEPPAPTVCSMAFSPDGKCLATASSNKTVKFWDAASGQEVLSLNGNPGGANSLAFSPDGKRLATASDDGTVKLWDAASGQELKSFKGHAGPVHGVAFSPDGKRLASASEDKTLKVWDLTGDQEALTLKGHTGRVNSVAFSPDGKRLASGSDDMTVKVWYIASGQEVLTLKGATADRALVWGPSGVKSVAFSPDGKRLASAASSGTIMIWGTTKSMKEFEQE